MILLYYRHYIIYYRIYIWLYYTIDTQKMMYPRISFFSHHFLVAFHTAGRVSTWRTCAKDQFCGSQSLARDEASDLNGCYSDLMGFDSDLNGMLK